MILRNGYVRATLLVLLLTIIAGIVQANMHGPIWIFAFSGVFLGSFLVLILSIMSIFSVVKAYRKPNVSPNQNINIKVKPQADSAAHNKRRLLWSLALAAPGLLIWLSAAFTTRNGGGEAYILVIPLFFVSFIALFAALLYGMAYLFKKGE